MNLQENIRKVLREEIDDYLDAINYGGYIYWDEIEKLFLGKNLDRPRNLDKIQSRLVDLYPDIIFFKDGNNILIPYYIDGDIISGGSYRTNERGIVYRLWNNKNGYIEYGLELEDDLDGLINEVGDQLEIDGGRPYIEDNTEYDDIDEWRIEKIESYLVKKTNRYVSDWVKTFIPNKRYWDHKKSISDIAEYIVNNNLWDKVKDDVMNLQESIRRILREENTLPNLIRRRFSEEELYKLVSNVERTFETHRISQQHREDVIDAEVDDFIMNSVYYGEFEDFDDEIYQEIYNLYREPLVDYIKSKIDMNLQESIKKVLREELNNRGDCNIMYVPEQFSKLDRFSNLWDMVVNEIDELIEVSQLEKELLPKDITVYSVQEKFDTDYVKRMDDERYNKSDISLFKYKNKLYIIDGHHRLCYDRINNRDSYVYIFDKDDSQIVDCIFYGIGDC